MDIVAITDKSFVMPTGVMLYSVCVNNPDIDIIFHIVVDESVTQRNKDDLSDTVTNCGSNKTIQFYYISREICYSFPEGDQRQNITYATYYRLFLTEVLPQSLNKVLYMDGDIIVRHTLLPLWETDIRDYAIAAVPDSYEGIIDKFNRLRYPPSEGYFNAGVMLINLSFWRNNHITREFKDFITNRSGDIVSHDQDVLNVIFKDRKLMIPIKYNLQSGFFYKEMFCDYWKYKTQIDDAIIDPVIVHFTLKKPWEIPVDKHPFNSTFFKYQNQTLWKGQRIDCRSLKGQLRRNVGNILRFLGILPPRKNINRFVELSPID